ncbi:hypothetical protein GEMRC1_004235 [Eukaryota sp. GEM-RC1]
MSRIPSDQLRTAIETILKASEDKKRNFTETIELQIGLKNYDPKKDKRFAGTFELPVCPRPNLSCCVLGDASHCEEAEALGLPFMNTENLTSLKKNAKLVKKLCKKYAFFLASESVLKNLPRLVGPLKEDDLMQKVNEMRSTIKFQLKKALNLNVAAGNVTMNADDLSKNVILSINFLISLLKKGWTNINTIHIKSSMGKPIRLF